MELPSGESIFESVAICKHFAKQRVGLYGGNLDEAVKCDEMIKWSETNIRQAVVKVAMTVFGHKSSSQSEFANDMTILKSHAEFLNEYLQGKSYLVSYNPTVADIVVA